MFLISKKGISFARMTRLFFEDMFEGNYLCQWLSGNCHTATSGLTKNRGLRRDLFGLWPNMSPDSTYGKTFIKLALDEAE